MLRITDLDRAVDIFLDPPRHGELGDSCMRLPDWFDSSLSAESPAFLDQQMHLWREITRRSEYDPLTDEDTPEISGMDAIFRPAFYAGSNAFDAGQHLMAMGHILIRSGLSSSTARVLECGAGFGQNALTFARLGMKVDTVDVGPGFCEMVRKSAEHFGVDLTPHQVPFGENPAGHPEAYDLVFFYESFHHCLEFKRVIPKLRDMLKPHGRIILAGEPISRTPDENMPYPWGVRLHWTNVAVMRQRGWMELGFQENYLVRQFQNAGMIWHFYPDPNSPTAQVYEFIRWRQPIELSSSSMTLAEDASWHGREHNGRWTKDRSYLGIPTREGKIVIDLVNNHSAPRHGNVSLGKQSIKFNLNSSEKTSIVFLQKNTELDQQLVFHSNTEIGSMHDPRALGIFVERISPT